MWLRRDVALTAPSQSVQVGQYRLACADQPGPLGQYRSASTDRSVQIGQYRSVSTDRSVQIGHVKQAKKSTRGLGGGAPRDTMAAFSLISAI